MTEMITVAIDWLVRNSASVLLASLLTFMLITAIFLVSTWRLRRAVQRYQALLSELNQRSVETLLFDQVETTRVTKAAVEQFKQRLDNLELAAQHHLQRVGVVRFNAFDDVGSDLSFAIALMDQDENGLVISYIQGREEGRAYAKPITRGRSSYPLAKEELLAIQKTRAQEGLPMGKAGETALASE